MGEMLREFIRLSPQGTHFEFEPLPDLFAGLKPEFGGMLNVLLLDSIVLLQMPSGLAM